MVRAVVQSPAMMVGGRQTVSRDCTRMDSNSGFGCVEVWVTPFRLFYVSISVPDMWEAVHWYEEKLGFHLVRQKDFPDFGTRIGVVQREDFRVELIEQRGAVLPPLARGVPPDHTNVLGISQFAYLCDDLDAMMAELKSKGVEPIWVKRVDHDLGLSFQFIADNNGNLIQFVELMKPAQA